jgi:hypothetical protein
VVNSAFVTPRFVPTLLLASVVLGGCGGEENRPAAWSYLSPAIIQPNCATGSCHSRGTAVARLDLSTAEEGWKDLTQQRLPTVVGGDPMRNQAPRPLVIPGNPTQSRMLNMLRAFGADRMPPDRPLPEADILLIERWILQGATNE